MHYKETQEKMKLRSMYFYYDVNFISTSKICRAQHKHAYYLIECEAPLVRTLFTQVLDRVNLDCRLLIDKYCEELVFFLSIKWSLFDSMHVLTLACLFRSCVHLGID